MSDTLRRLCFSNAPFHRVKLVFFDRWVLGLVGVALAIGLPLALLGVAADQVGLMTAGLLLTLPFQLWVGLLTVVSFILAIPRLLVLCVALAAVYFGLPGISKRLAEWAANGENPPKPATQPTSTTHAGAAKSDQGSLGA